MPRQEPHEVESSITGLHHSNFLHVKTDGVLQRHVPKSSRDMAPTLCRRHKGKHCTSLLSRSGASKETPLCSTQNTMSYLSSLPG